MKPQEMQPFNDALNDVMVRFRSFFLAHLDQDHVPFRHRDDFAAPLVTVMGYTYGIRLVEGEEKAGNGGTKLAVEVSANVYDDEFELDRFRSRMKEAHHPDMVRRTVENFMISEDEPYIEKEGPLSFPDFFSYDLVDDLQLVEKHKDIPSSVTGRLVDSVLVMNYWLKSDKVEQLSRDLRLFSSAVHLYCLRSFVLAYHKSVTSD
jgi:hypothetical protein